MGHPDRLLILLAGFAEADFWPLLDCRAQIPGVAGNEYRHAVVVLGAGRRVRDAEAIELGRVVDARVLGSQAVRDPIALNEN